MKKEQLISRGFSLVEILIGLAILAIAVTSGLVLISQQQFLVSNKEQTVRAQTLASEGLEATKTIANKNWNDLTVGEHGLIFSNNEWQFSGNQDLQDIFIRKIIISDIDSKTKQITSRVEWNSGKVEMLLLLTDWESVLENGGEPESDDPGLSGNWANPQTLTSIDIGAGRQGTDVIVKDSKVYISSTASDSAKKDISIYDVSGLPTVTLLGELDIGGQGIHSLALNGNFLYAASPDNDNEFMIIDVSNPNAPAKVSQLDLPANADALSIFYSNNFTYLGRDDSAAAELTIINVGLPTNPQIASTLEMNEDVEDIFVLDQRVYLAIDDSDKTLTILDVSNPDVPQEIGFLNINDRRGRSVFVQSSSRVFLGTDSKFYALDAANPSSIAIRGSININGSVNDMVIIGNFAFLATSNANSEFIVLNVTDPTNIQQINAFNFPQQATGVDYENNLIFVSVRSNDALRIVTSQ